MIGLLAFSSRAIIYTAIALVGYGNSNVFSMAFSEALIALPDKKNEVSGLMIMGLFGGTLFPLAMGYASDAVRQSGGCRGCDGDRCDLSHRICHSTEKIGDNSFNSKM
jgi:fucose permease